VTFPREPGPAPPGRARGNRGSKLRSRGERQKYAVISLQVTGSPYAQSSSLTVFMSAREE
jgi:hypothetical protein